MADTLDTRLAISVSDNATQPLTRINAAMRSVGRSGKEAGKEASDGLQKVGKAAQGAESFAKSFATSLTKIPLGYAAAGAAAAAFAVESYRAGAQAQRATERIGQGANMSAAQLATLGNKTREWAEISGESYDSVLQSFMRFQQASNEAPENAEKVFTSLLKTAQVTGTGIDTLSEAVNTASRNLNISKIEISDSLRNMPAAGSQALAKSLGELARQMNNIGLVGSKNFHELVTAKVAFTKATGSQQQAIADLSTLLAQMGDTGSIAYQALLQSGGDFAKSLQAMKGILHNFYKEAQSSNFAIREAADTNLRALANQVPMFAKEIDQFLASEKQIQEQMKKTGETHAQASAKWQQDNQDLLQSEHALAGAWADAENSFAKMLGAFYVPQALKTMAELMDSMSKDAKTVSGALGIGAGAATGAIVGGAVAGPLGAVGGAAIGGYIGGGAAKPDWKDWRNPANDMPLPFGHRAGGGPVDSGRPYIVGEKGPELFVPTSSGAIATQGVAASFRSESEDKNTAALRKLTDLLEHSNIAADPGVLYGPSGPAGTGIYRNGIQGGAPTSYGGSAGISGARGGPSGAAGHGSTGAANLPSTSSAGNLTRLIAEASKKAGIDPRIMEGIRAGESGHGRNYDIGDIHNGPAYGPFQLNVGHGRLGWKFEHETGLDLRDPKTIPAQATWVANYIAHRLKENPGYNPGSEWFGFHGLRNALPRWGDSGYAPDTHVGALHPHHEAMLNSFKAMRAEMEKPIKLSIEAPKLPPQLGGIRRRVAQRHNRVTSENMLEEARYESAADFMA